MAPKLKDQVQGLIDGPTNQQGLLERAIELEKQTRLEQDSESSRKLLPFIANYLVDQGDDELLLDTVRSLTKKRALIASAVSLMVDVVVDECLKPSFAEDLVELYLDRLIKITAGQIHLELQWAHLVRRKAERLVADGDIDQARDLLLGVKVDQIGAMKRSEKVDFLTFQVGVLLDAGDVLQAGIFVRKVTPQVLQMEAVLPLRRSFLKQRIRYEKHENKYLDVAVSNALILDLEELLEEDVDLLNEALLYAFVAEPTVERMELLRKLSTNTLKPEPTVAALLTLLLSQELIDSSVIEPLCGMVPDESLLRARVLEHNLRVVSSLFTDASLTKLSELCDASEEQVESTLVHLIVDEGINGKIDRPSKTINFEIDRSAAEILNEYGSRVSDTIATLETVVHMINVEKTA